MAVLLSPHNTCVKRISIYFEKSRKEEVIGTYI